MYERPEPTLPILLLGVVFHDARYVEDVDELQLWRWSSDAHRTARSRRLPDGDALHHDEQGVLIGVSVHDAARRARLQLPVQLGERYRIPPTVLRDLIFTATVVDEELARPAVSGDAARELRGLLDAVSDLVAGSAEELTAAELSDLHDRLLAAVAEWADPLGIRPFDAPAPLPTDFLDVWEPPRLFDERGESDDTRSTTVAQLQEWADGARDRHPMSDPPVCATDAQLLALLHHARRAELPPAGVIHASRRHGCLEARLRGAGTVALDAGGRVASSGVR